MLNRSTAPLLIPHPGVWALGALGMFICGARVYQGAKTTVAMNMALFYSVSLALIALGAVMWLGERLS